MKYKILSTTDKKLLTQNVMKHLEEGWSLQGGVSITTKHETDIFFAQAIIKN